MWNKLKTYLDQQANATQSIKLTLQLFFTFIVIFSTRHQSPYVYLNFAFFIALLLQLALVTNALMKPLFWYTILFFLAIRLYADYYLAANHLFVCIYLTLAILVYLHTGKDEGVLRKNFQIILGLVLFFSGFQKLISGGYTHGQFFEYMLYRGDFLWPLKYLSPHFAAATQANKALMQEAAQSYGIAGTVPLLTAPIPHAAAVARVLTHTSVWLEIVAGIAVLFSGKKWYAHALAAATIIGVAITRQEFGFLSLLTISALPLCRWRWLLHAYTVLIVLLHAGIIIRLGFL